MRLFLLIILAFGHVSAFSQGVSKSGSDDLYLYKAKVLYKDGNGFIADVQKNFDSISVLFKYDELFLRVIKEKETIIRHVRSSSVDTLSYGKIKEYTKQGQSLKGSSLAYFLGRNDSLKVGETFYFNSYGIVASNPLAQEFGMPVLAVGRPDEPADEENEDDEEISIVETGDKNFPYKVKVPEQLKNKVYTKTSSYQGRQIADYYKKGSSQFFAIINKQTSDTSFILGSMHFTESAFWNKKINQPEILQRLFSCQALYFESMSDLVMVTEDSINKNTNEQHKELDHNLTAEQKTFFRHKYNSLLRRSGIAYIDLVTLHPAVISNIFAFTFFAEKNIFLEDIVTACVQQEFIKKMRIDFDFKELDTDEEFSKVGKFRGKYFTTAVLINELKTMETDFKAGWRYYENGDVEKIFESVKNKYGESFCETLIIQRNENWVPRMIKGMQQEKCFFIVGAAHLGGKHGLLHLLKEKGYTILPLKWLN